MEVVTALIGLLGVAVGAVFSSWLPERIRRRSQARDAARLALVGLERWHDAIGYMRRAPERLGSEGEDYDIFLARELRALRQHLDNDWWDRHGQTLTGVATPEQWSALKGAGLATRALLMMLGTVGDAPDEALRRRARSRELRAIAERVARKPAAAAVGAGGVPLPPRVDDDKEAAREQELQEADRGSDEFDRFLSRFDAEFRADLAEFSVQLDHRLFAVRELTSTLVRADERVSAAAAACAEIEKANGGR